MNVAESFRDKTFVVEDSDARIRLDEDLMAFALDTGGRFLAIPKNTKVKIVEVKVGETGSRTSIVFGRATSADGIQVFGWTSTRNLRGKLMNETIGIVQPELGAGRFGPNAAWSDGEYLGQLELVAIVDSKLEIERLALTTIEPYTALVAAAARNVSYPISPICDQLPKITSSMKYIFLFFFYLFHALTNDKFEPFIYAGYGSCTLLVYVDESILGSKSEQTLKFLSRDIDRRCINQYKLSPSNYTLGKSHRFTVR